MGRVWTAVTVICGLIAVITTAILFEHGLAHFFGVDTQGSQNYDFVSGVGPMIITSIGYGGLIAGLWHHVNCHQTGCWRISRHKVDGSPWCNRHHDQARTTAAKTLDDVVERLDRIGQLLEHAATSPAGQAAGRIAINVAEAALYDRPPAP